MHEQPVFRLVKPRDPPLKLGSGLAHPVNPARIAPERIIQHGGPLRQPVSLRARGRGFLRDLLCAAGAVFNRQMPDGSDEFILITLAVM